MITERIGDAEIVLVTPVIEDLLGRPPCTPSACAPNVPCNPNTQCNPFNCMPALKPCMPECAPALPCNPTGKPPEPPKPPQPPKPPRA